MFNPKNIDNLTAEDFKSFLDFRNNKHWTSLERKGSEITLALILLQQLQMLQIWIAR